MATTASPSLLRMPRPSQAVNFPLSIRLRIMPRLTLIFAHRRSQDKLPETLLKHRLAQVNYPTSMTTAPTTYLRCIMHIQESCDTSGRRSHAYTTIFSMLLLHIPTQDTTLPGSDLTQGMGTQEMKPTLNRKQNLLAIAPFWIPFETRITLAETGNR